MALLIQDEAVEREIERLAKGWELTPVELIKRAVQQIAQHEPTQSLKRPSRDQFFAAIREAQEAFQMHGNMDRRTPDEIVGYNEHGHFD